MTKLFLLQSGFVTPNTSYLIREKAREMTLRDSLYQNDSRINDSNNYYDEIVERLFQLYHKDNSLLRTFEFREEILETALRVFSFNSPSIGAWIYLQLSQRTVGFLHRRYLKETINFAGLREPRAMENYTYYRLLNSNVDSNGFKTTMPDPTPELKEYNLNGSALLTDFIQRWTRDVKGIADLLVSMHVIFGDRRESQYTPGTVV